LGVDIDVVLLRLFAAFTGLANTTRNSLSLRQWLIEKLRLPRGTSNLGSKVLIRLVAQTKRITVAEQPALRAQLKG
jgi:hypothetical protein